MALVGLLFASIGGGLIAASFRQGFDGNEIALRLSMSLFVVIGVFIMLSTLRATLRRRRMAQAPAHAPWRGDVPWQPDVAPGNEWRDLRYGIAATIVIGLMLVVFLYVFFYDAPSSGVQMAVASFFLLPWGIIVLVVGGVVGWRVLRVLKFGRTAVRYRQFPMFLDEGPIEMTVEGGLWLASHPAVHLRLVAVTEEQVISRVGNRHQSHLQFTPVWQEERTARCDSAGNLTISFDPPAGAPGTSFTAVPAVYWELEVFAPLAGTDFHACYLLPIYRRVAPVG